MKLIRNILYLIITVLIVAGFLNRPPGDRSATAFIPISDAGRIEAGAVLALLAAAFAIIAYRRFKRDPDRRGPSQHISADRLARATQGTNSTAPRPVTAADKKLAHDMLLGMVKQVQHENDMIEARGKEAVSVRLAPQIPIRDFDRPRSWLGGSPMLPADVAWPEIDGKPAYFLAQICCADLPADLWGGLGPRQGWLTFFIHPENCEMRLLLATEQGEPRQSAAMEANSWFAPAHGLRHGKLEAKAVHAFPQWPIDIVAVTLGGPDPRQEGRADILHEQYRQGYDLASPAQQPFDWPSTCLMVDMGLQAIRERTKDGDSVAASARAQNLISQHQLNLEKAIKDGTPEDRIVELRLTLAEISEGAELSRQNIATAQDATPRLARLAEHTRSLASTTPFSPEIIAPIIAEMHAVGWVFKHVPPFYRDGQKLSPQVRAKEGVHLVNHPMTTHDPLSSFWVHEFEAIRFDWAKHAYCKAQESLPPVIRSHYERTWKDVAAHEMAGMGHVPFNYVHQFDEQTDVTLIELPTSGLMSWMFGDVDNLVVTMKKADLAAGNFTALTVQVSN